jgi:predicted membrane protein
VALFWRLFGISHKSLEPLAIALLCWTALAAYGIMRLGMGKILSFLLALVFTFSPPVLLLLPSLRDFSKAPFLLSLIFALGYLVHYCRNSKGLLFWAIALGVLHGVAMGFRQDALIFTPLVLVVLLVVSALIYRLQDVTNNHKLVVRS